MSKQDIRDITASELLSTVQDFKTDGWRLGQACATTVDGGVDILYSLDKDHTLVNLKLHVKNGEAIQSITHIFWAAFIYENEIQDLFGVEFKNMALNYEGHFFKTTESTPWNPESSYEPKDIASEVVEEVVEAVEEVVEEVAEAVEEVVEEIIEEVKEDE